MTITWEAPAGGLWELETVHVLGGQPRLFQERAPAAFKEGFQLVGKRYGLPIDYLDMRFVNDHCYARMRPVGAPDPKPGKASAPPAPLALKLLARIHPELRRRAKTARHALAHQTWHRDLDRWERELRGEMHASGRALQAEPIEQFDDAALIDHLRRAADHFDRGCVMHFELMPVHDLPVGRLLLACRRWGIDDADALGLLAGSSPASKASTTGLAGIAAACASAGVEPESLDDVRGAGTEAQRALDEYLADHAWRVMAQYTPRGLALIEMPDVLVRAIRTAGDGASGDDPVDPEPLRQRVPAEDRARFDALLVDARRCYGVRDDNVALTFMWPAGLVRRALLEIGRRLVERRLLTDASHALALGEAELAAALAGDADVATAASTRVARMEAYEADSAPLRLGDDEGPPPDPSLFPPATAELLAALFVGFDLDMAVGQSTDVSPTWSGTGAGIGTTAYSGRACVAASPEEALSRLQPGDVLVTTITTPAFEAVMPIAGAVVTEHGGLMGHTALVCREYGIPAVVGVVGATSCIADGAELTVVPSEGRVLLAAPVLAQD